jgi:hypothetical protein
MTVVLQPDGNVLVGGGFATYDGIPVGHSLARLHPDGSLDTDLDTGEGAIPNIVNAIAIRSDGALMIGGGFREFHGIGRNRIARLFNDISTEVPIHAMTVVPDVAYLGGSSYLVRVDGSEHWDVSLFDVSGRALKTLTRPTFSPEGVMVDLNGLPPGSYALHLSSKGTTITTQLIAP